jgi:organic radical activating enzyme
LPNPETFKGYDEIVITGGEPLLVPLRVLNLVQKIRGQTDAKIYMYTAMLDSTFLVLAVLSQLDGITVTLHEQDDVYDFHRLDDSLTKFDAENKSLRLNVFKGIDYGTPKANWVIKDNIDWIKNCPLPENEVLMKYY